MQVDTADCAQRSYYSIHLESFKNLRNANAFVNALKIKGKVVFWKKTDVPGKGIFYRVYMGKYNNRAEALEFWEKLKKAGAVSYRGIHKFDETIFPQIAEGRRTLTRPKEVIKDRFTDNHDGTVTDTKTNLMWIKNGWRLDFVSAVTWRDAITKCDNFRLGGHTDWSLPTKKEWDSLIDPSKQCPALVEPNPFENIIVHMPYWSKTELAKSPVQAYTVMLYSGNINHQNKNDMAFILPVRSID